MRAENGVEAVAAIIRERFDLILMDIQMLGPDRPGATEQIRALSAARWASTPFIVLTANAMQGDREKCLAVRMDEVRVQTY